MFKKDFVQKNNSNVSNAFCTGERQRYYVQYILRFQRQIKSERKHLCYYVQIKYLLFASNCIKNGWVWLYWAFHSLQPLCLILDTIFLCILHHDFSLSNGATARGGPRPPSRISSILPGIGRLFSSFYTLAFLHSIFPTQPGALSSWLTEEDSPG